MEQMLNSIILTTRSRLAAVDSRLKLRTRYSKLGKAVDSELRTQNLEPRTSQRLRSQWTPQQVNIRFLS